MLMRIVLTTSPRRVAQGIGHVRWYTYKMGWLFELPVLQHTPVGTFHMAYEDIIHIFMKYV